MTVIISGDNGVSDVDGSAGTPAIRGTDANTGIFFPAADTIAFAEGGAEAMRIDANGNVGIGTTSPTESASNKTFTLNAPAAAVSLIDFKTNETLNFRIGSGPSDTFIVNKTNIPMYFATNDIERARIDSSGNLLVGTTSENKAPLTVAKAPASSAYGQIAAFSVASGDVGNAGISVTKYDNNTTTSQVFARFLVNQGATASGQINANGASAAAFGSYSDRRLKQNIVDLSSQLENICNLRPVEFDYIESEGGGHQIGFIAQEMQDIYPDVVGEREPDKMLSVTGWSKTEARLVKAIQELKAINDAQASRIETLEAKVAALEANNV